MSNKKGLITSALGITLALGACSQENPTSSTEGRSQQTLEVSNIDLEGGLQASEAGENPRALDITFDRKENSSFATEFDFSSSRTTPIEADSLISAVVQLKAPNGTIYYGQTSAKATGKKSLSLQAKNLSFRSRNNNTETLPSTNLEGWKVRVFLGGTYDANSGRVSYGNGSMTVLDAPTVKLSKYSKNIPVVSSWSEIKAEKMGNRLGFHMPRTSDGTATKLKFKPEGNILRIQISNEARNLELRRVRFSSQDVCGSGYYELSATGSNSWRSVETNSQIPYETSAIFTDSNKTINKGSKKYIYTWVKQVPDEALSRTPAEGITRWSRMTIYLRDAVNNINFSYLAWGKGTGTTHGDGVSSPIKVTMTQEMAVQPAYYMAPYFLTGSESTGYKLGTTHETKTPATSGNYYSKTDADRINAKSTLALETRLVDDEGYWVENSPRKTFHWHIADADDVGGVYPLLLAAFDQKNYTIQVKEETLKLDGTNRQTYYCLYYRPKWATTNPTPTDDVDVFYALRFLKKGEQGYYEPTPYTAAFRYARHSVWKDQRNGTPDATLFTSVRPLGTFFTAKYSDHYLMNIIAKQEYWSTSKLNADDIHRRLPALGQSRGGSNLLNNGFLMKFWVPNAGSISNMDGRNQYTVGNEDNAAFYFNRDGLASSGLNLGGKQATSAPILMFRDRELKK